MLTNILVILILFQLAAIWALLFHAHRRIDRLIDFIVGRKAKAEKADAEAQEG